MNDIFLKAKHWQFFLISYAIPMVVQIIIMKQVIIQENPDPFQLFQQLWWMPLFGVLFMFVLLGWQWAVVIGLNEKIRPELRFGLNRFKIFFILPLIYMLLMILGVSYLISEIIPPLINDEVVPDVSSLGFWIAVIIPLHFFAIFCMFHTMYFVAKTIKTAELKRKVTFSDFVSEFFLIWFFPIGIWVLQPRINQLVDGEEDLLVDQMIA